MGRPRKSSPIERTTSSGVGRRTRDASKVALEGRVRELEARLELLERAVRELTARDRPAASEALPEPPSPRSPEPRVLEGEVLDAIRSLDREGRLDGLVPIPWVRRRFPSFQRLQLDRALLELERGFRIDLKIANDPIGVEAPGDGIPHPARGLLYFAVVR